MTPTLVLVGAKPNIDGSQHPGGQLTASLGLAKYAAEYNNFNLKVIDTTQSSFPVPPFKERLKKGLVRIKELIALISAGGVVGVVIFSSSGFSFYERVMLALVARIRGVKAILFVRSGHFIDELQGSSSRRFFARLALRVPELIGAQGESWKDFYRQLGVPEHKVKIVRNWLSPDIQPEGKPKFVKENAIVRFIFVGWLVEKKGVRELLEAALELSHKYKFELCLVGGGTLQDEVASFVAVNGLDGVVHSLGWQKPESVLSLLQSAHVFVLPSKAEGFPNAMLEAMAMGLPLIVTDVGSVADSLVNGRNGVLLSESTAQQVAEAMERYLVDNDLITAHSLQSLEIVKANHSYLRNCETLLSNFNI